MVARPELGPYKPRRTVVAGRTVVVLEKRDRIHPTLELLLNGGRDKAGRRWTAMRVTVRRPIPTLAGATAACVASSNGDADQDHRLVPWIAGFAIDVDAIARYLELHLCADCGAVCVRDRSIDELPNLPAGRRPLRRKDEVIGWYSGARPRGRQYA